MTIPAFQRLGSEFMPPLDEGSLLYMPSTLPGISVGQAQQLMQTQDRIIKRFPEVETRTGQGGPRGDLHRPGAAFDDGNRDRAEAGEPVAQGRIRGTPRGRRHGPERSSGRFTPDHISTDQLVDEMNQALKIRAPPTPGPCPSKAAWTCSPPASARRWASRCTAPILKKIERDRHANRGGAAKGARHA